MTLFYILAARKEWTKWVEVGELKIGKAMGEVYKIDWRRLHMRMLGAVRV